MFKIFVTVLLLGTPQELVSRVDYPTFEACEAARPESVEKLKKDLTEAYPEYKPEVQDSKCDKAPE